MKSARFSYVRATSLDDVFAQLERHGSDARLLAGGQTLLPSLAFRLAEPAVVIDIGRLADLKGIALAGDVLRIGAAVTHAQLGADAHVRKHAALLTEAVPHIAHAAIRNRGTIGGSLAYADPAAELPACVLALGAHIVVQSRRGVRAIPAEAFFKGLFETALAADELIVRVDVPVASVSRRHGFYEIVRRSGDYAMAGAVTTADVVSGVARNVRVVAFGVAAVPVSIAPAAAALEGQALSAERIGAAVAAARATLSPTPDQHGDVDTKRQLAGVAVGRALGRLAGATGEPSI